ncbi:hypothetical protein BHU72_10235 [Desulfuribacillus stibiiarsenatis]|uniref:DNA-binding response regulator n=1 Tax=Desulfuribacillus stibiiarsenatis TaxID=1390249 RepID=A0A1E5L8Z9_9FIRM|nr:response regulator transcription factor [Desulfuribacillus stibiiarsenatis]OEH86625.1 hypothetical protein BHU72_10235 [Desulfuribacillus stibiiarsenatis]
MTIKILVVDDHTVLRSGLAMLLNSQDDMEVIGEAGTAFEATALVAKLQPDVVLMDINLPDKNGMDLSAEIISVYGNIKILFLTMHDEAEYIGKVLQIGGAGYILKSAADKELLDAIRAVSRGEFVLYKGLKENVANQLMNKKQKASIQEVSLTKREADVLRLIALGYTQQEIADQLFVSIKTVESHKSNIMEKMNTKKRSDLVKYALEHDIIKVGE